jgi:hypothetical protein
MKKNVIKEHCKKLMQVSIDSEINSLEHEKSKHTCIFIYYHLPNVGAVGSVVLVSVEELSFVLTEHNYVNKLQLSIVISVNVKFTVTDKKSNQHSKDSLFIQYCLKRLFMTYLHQFFVFFGQMLKTTREHCKKLMQVSIDSEINSL